MPTFRLTSRLAAACLIAASLHATPAFANEDVSSASVDTASCRKPVLARPDLLNPEQVFEDRKTTVYDFLVGIDGKVRDIKLMKSSGHRDLDRAVAVAFVKCTFTPASKDGQPGQSWLQMEYDWSQVDLTATGS